MLPLLEAVEEADTHCTPGIGHAPSPGGMYTCLGYTVKDCGGANSND